MQKLHFLFTFPFRSRISRWSNARKWNANTALKRLRNGTSYSLTDFHRIRRKEETGDKKNLNGVKLLEIFFRFVLIVVNGLQ